MKLLKKIWAAYWSIPTRLAPHEPRARMALRIALIVVTAVAGWEIVTHEIFGLCAGVAGLGIGALLASRRGARGSILALLAAAICLALSIMGVGLPALLLAGGLGAGVISRGRDALGGGNESGAPPPPALGG